MKNHSQSMNDKIQFSKFPVFIHNKIVLRNAFGISFLIEVLTGLVCSDGCRGISVLHNSSVDNDSGEFWDLIKFGLIFLNCGDMRSLVS